MRKSDNLFGAGGRSNRSLLYVRDSQDMFSDVTSYCSDCPNQALCSLRESTDLQRPRSSSWQVQAHQWPALFRNLGFFFCIYCFMIVCYVAGPSSFPGSSPSLLLMDSKNMALFTCLCQSSLLLAVTTLISTQQVGGRSAVLQGRGHRSGL